MTHIVTSLSSDIYVGASVVNPFWARKMRGQQTIIEKYDDWYTNPLRHSCCVWHSKEEPSLIATSSVTTDHQD